LSLNLSQVKQTSEIKDLAPQIAKLILSDEVCQTMSRSSTSQDFVAGRIIEIVQSALI